LPVGNTVEMEFGMADLATAALIGDDGIIVNK
jgi:hypothetical protein